ncbi:grainyhead-like [Mortierella sp. GBA30]|nr:grainyhead-like [Mortierella sp. GBA30]
MQHQGDTPVTYLNKGQFYTISLQDTEEYDGDIHSVIKVTFHEEAHRKLAARYWSFWLSQQTNPKTARALDIEKASSTGMMEVHSKTFDRISFKWNGKAGAKLMVRFNCLSTDFSRIKGVKGIPLRVHMDTMLNGGTFSNNEQDQAVERSYAKIKLFRDKGAERKNKDDHKHLEKMWDKMRGKNADTNPLSQVLAPVQSVSVFWECLDHQQDSAEDETLDLSETLVHESLETNPNASGGGGESGRNESSSSLLTASSTVDSSSGAAGEPLISESNALVPASKKRRRANETIVISGGFNSTSGALERASHYSNGGGMSEGAPSSDQLLDRDPTYVPQIRKKKQPALCLYIKIGGEAVYRAVYLERLTLAELTQKLSEKLEIQSSTISGVYKKTTKKELMVRVDDSMVAQMTDELDMVVEYEFNQMDGSVNLTLKY